MGGKRRPKRGGSGARRGNLAATARLVHPAPEAELDRAAARKVLADFCRLIGTRWSATSTWPIQAGEELGRQIAAERSRSGPDAGGAPAAGANGYARHDSKDSAPPPATRPERDGLAPRLEQTLSHLLRGDSEKQIAAKLNLSRHTVHVYVKSLYRHYNVSSRGELLARWVRR